MKILLISTEPSQLIFSPPYVVTQAWTAEEGLKALVVQNEYEVVMVDQWLRGSNGLLPTTLLGWSITLGPVPQFVGLLIAAYAASICKRTISISSRSGNYPLESEQLLHFMEELETNTDLSEALKKVSMVSNDMTEDIGRQSEWIKSIIG